MKNEKENDKEKRPGPDPERLKIDEEDWEDAVKRALEKEKPEEGWPEDQEEPANNGGKG